MTVLYLCFLILSQTRRSKCQNPRTGRSLRLDEAGPQPDHSHCNRPLPINAETIHVEYVDHTTFPFPYSAHSHQAVVHDQLYHTDACPSAPAPTSHGWRGTQRTANTPNPSCTVCPRRILSGTMSGFVIRSLYTRAWNTWIEPSSDDDANSGYVGWNTTERSARAWYLSDVECQTSVSVRSQERETGNENET